MVDAYLDYLRVERRLARHTLESYARDLSALAAYADETRRAIERLDRAAPEGFVRPPMFPGPSPRPVARALAAGRCRRRLPRAAVSPGFGGWTGGSTGALPTICPRRARGLRCRSSSRSTTSIG